MCELDEWTINVTQDRRTGHVFAYVLEAEDGQWGWLADHEFGPFDTVLDLATWVCRMLATPMARPMR